LKKRLRSTGSGREGLLLDRVSDLNEALSGALRRVRRGSPFATVAEDLSSGAESTAALATMHFPRWAEEMAGGRLSRAQRRTLLEAQAHLLAWIILRDGLADAEPDSLDDLPDLMPVLFEAQALLSRLFGPRDPFWRDYRRLVRQQVDADRWERSGNAAADPALVQRLGRKASLLRWPAWGVARLSGRHQEAPSIDRAFDRLLATLQLFDDVADALEDARTGQVNAVLAAESAAGHPGGVALHAAILRGTAPVYRMIRHRLRALRRCPGGLGAYAAALLDRSGESETRSLAAAQARTAAEFLKHVLRAAGRELKT